MDIRTRKLIMNSFINSHFGYCPLVWMCHSRNMNNRINKIQENAFRIVYNEPTLSYVELLKKDGTVTIHERNIQLATEVYKIIKGYSPKIMHDIFQLKQENIYHSTFPFTSWNIKTVSYGTHSIGYLGPKLWSLVPEDLQKLDSLDKFKSKIRKWKQIGSPCRKCKNYKYGVGFVE